MRRTGIEDIKSLAAMIVQSERFGTSLSQALKVYADALRTRRRLRAEAAVAKAGIKMLFPIVLFILPVLFVITLVPGVLTVLHDLKSGIGPPRRETNYFFGAFHVFVEDCDAAYRRALEAGAVTLMGAVGEPADRPYGERSAFVEDAFGNYWYIATRLASAPAAEGPLQGLGTVLPFVHPEGARKYIDFLKRAFGAEEMAVYEHSGRVMHAAVRVGDAVLEMGEAAGRTGIPSNGFFLFAEDVEAAYARALAAGATAIRPPEDIPYGLLELVFLMFLLAFAAHYKDADQGQAEDSGDELYNVLRRHWGQVYNNSGRSVSLGLGRGALLQFLE